MYSAKPPGATSEKPDRSSPNEEPASSKLDRQPDTDRPCALPKINYFTAELVPKNYRFLSSQLEPPPTALEV